MKKSSQQAGFRTIYTIPALDGGLNDKYEPNIIEDIESPDCLNVVFDDRGGVQTRLGSSKLNTTAVGSFAGDGLFTTRFNDGSQTMVAWWNGSMFQLATTTFTTVPSAQSVFTAGTKVDGAMYQNLMFFGNGGSKPMKYNGTEFTRHGIPQPNSSPTTTSGTAGAAGAQTGDINYKVSYVNSYVVESDVSAQTTTLTVASTATVSLAAIPIAPTSYGVNARKIYRKDAGTGGSFKLVTTISDNTTSTYLDNTASASLGAVAPTDQGEPINWKYIEVFQNRLFMVETAINPQFLYYSEIAEPFVVKATNFFRVENGDGEQITGISVHANSIIIGKEKSIWILFMPDADDANWLLVKSNSKYGQASHYATAEYAELLMFIGKRYDNISGFHALSGADVQSDATFLTTTSIFADNKSDRIEPDVFGFVTAAIGKSVAIEFKNKLWFAVPYSSGAVNNRVYQFDYQRRDKARESGSWVPFSYAPFSIADFTLYNGGLYAQDHAATGFVYRLDVSSSYTDVSSAINSYFITKEFNGGEEIRDYRKDFRWLNFSVETLGAYFMNVGYRIDGSADGFTANQIDLNPGGSLWGTMIFGASTWGGGSVRKDVRLNLATSSGKKVQFKFDNKNTAGQGFHVLPNVNFYFNMKGLR